MAILQYETNAGEERQRMTPEAREFGAGLFDGLSKAARLQILEVLADGPSSVGDIARVTGIKQPMVSQHLAALYDTGVVVFERRGRSHLYRLRGPRIARILRLVEEFHGVHMDGLRKLLAKQDRTRTQGAVRRSFAGSR
jgi:DNA-binding transcriptional ArsR family regulator